MMERYRDTIEARWTGRYDASTGLVGDLAGKKILDIGCSIGWFEQFAVNKGCGLIAGMDCDHKLIDLGARAVPEAHFLRARASDLPFKSVQFDIVVMWDVLEHLHRGSAVPALHAAGRVLKAGGRLFLSVPKFDLRSTLTDPAWYVGHRHYTGKALEDLLERCGFHVVNIRSGGGLFEVLTMVLLYIFKWACRFEVPGKAFFERKRKEEYARGRGWSTYFVEAQSP